MVSFANVEITEIMYDLEGSDSGLEWIEIYNTSGSVDISQWHFYENDVHHGLLPDGFTMLDSGERAVIVQNVETMRPILGNTINLIKSSFSLNNTGEELAMSDSDKNIQSSATYSSEDGAVGNGYSLQKSGNNWIQAQPTPGKINSTTAGSNIIEPTLSSNSRNNNSVEKKPVIEKANFYSAYVNIIDQPIARSATQIEAYVTHTEGSKVIKKIKGGTYFINFGDGSYLELGERIDVSHVYEYSGNYEITFEFYSSRLSKENEDPPKAMSRKTITVIEPSIEIDDIDARGGIVLENTSDISIDMGEWNIHNISSDRHYIFPKYSIIAAGEKLFISKRVHGLGDIEYNNWITLRNEQKITLSSYTENSHKLALARNIPISTKRVDKDTVLETIPRTIPSYDVAVDITQTPLEIFLEQHPNKEFADFGDNTNTLERENQEPASTPINAVVISAVIALLLAGIRMFYKQQKPIKESDEVIGEIELIE